MPGGKRCARLSGGVDLPGDPFGLGLGLLQERLAILEGSRLGGEPVALGLGYRGVGDRLLVRGFGQDESGG